MRASIIALLVAAAAISPCAASESGSVDVVEAFIAALAKDKQVAVTMIAKDAQFGVGDVGGTLDLALLDTIIRDCSFEASAPEAHSLGMEGRAITVVEAAISCEVDGQPEKTLPAQFMVENGKIAALYLPVKSGRMELSDTSESENN